MKQYGSSVHLLEREVPQEISRAHKVRVLQPRAGLMDQIFSFMNSR